VNFEAFERFVRGIQALDGFAVTQKLLQQVFAELDPHKKTFLEKRDWVTAFKAVSKESVSLTAQFKSSFLNTFVDA